MHRGHHFESYSRQNRFLKFLHDIMMVESEHDQWIMKPVQGIGLRGHHGRGWLRREESARGRD